MIKIIGEGKFIYLIIAILKKENIFGKCIKYVLFIFFNCYNEVSEISFTYNFDHVLIYITCKFHVATTFHWLDVSPESQPSKMQTFD